jgi:hypothetical protein
VKLLWKTRARGEVAGLRSARNRTSYAVRAKAVHWKREAGAVKGIKNNLI